ncbi:hypothetical protein [Elizabethkingia anophelis]|uniref:hypothetical protein n=1 Tax=Elizabethkingia anophelis TaxID=1117645 RepID=UPI00320805FD
MLIPLHPEVISIIDKNEGHFPPSLNIKQYNDDIKEIARISGINETLKTRKRIGHRTKSLIIEKWQAITSHIGRRSFATNFYGKIPTPLLIEVTGHSTEKMFLNYINPIDNERVIALSNHFDRIYNNKIEYSYI